MAQVLVPLGTTRASLRFLLQARPHSSFMIMILHIQEASLADLSYLFEQGALIDFSVDELIPLVRALFADTPARANAIAKIQRGHPEPNSIP